LLDSAPLPLRDARDGRVAIHLLLLIAVAVGMRLVWMFVLPVNATSIDIDAWRRVAQGLALGINPYARSHLLNWPPFWMETIYFCNVIAVHFKCNFVSCIRGVLIIADAGVLAATFFLLRMLAPRAKYGILLLVGYCLNPLVTLLTVQHANFDAFAELWILLFLIFLVRYRRGGETIDFLLAAACLGMGGFTKTFPLMLWPLLAPGARRLSWGGRLLTCGLVIGPAALTLAPLYAMSPDAVFQDVLSYRGIGQSFGVFGVLNAIHLEPDLAVYSRIFTCVFLVGLAVLAARLWRKDLYEDSDVVLLATVILLASFVLGSAYGSQYWFWVIPLLLVCYREYRPLRMALLIAGVVIVGTNIYEYAVLPSLGQFWVWWYPSEGLEGYGEKLFSSPPDLARLRLGMTITSFWMLGACAAVLVRRMGVRRNTDQIAGASD
jgi:hypothetical protein